MTTIGDLTHGGRFTIQRRRMFGPFYSVRVVDTRTGLVVPLFRGGSLLLGAAAADRAAKYGIERYLRGRPEG